MEKKKIINWKEWYQAMMTGISYMTPLIVAGGIIQAIPNLWTNGAASTAAEGSVAYIMYTFGNGLMGLMYYVLAMYAAFSIANRPGLVAGLLAGFIACNGSSGFLGAIVGGIIAGYIAKALVNKLKLPAFMNSAKPILFIPLISSLLMILIMCVLIEPVCGWIMNLIYSGGIAIQNLGLKWLLLATFGVSVCFGMGGPFCVALIPLMLALIANGDLEVAATMNCAACASCYGTAAAVWIFKNKFTEAERASIPGLITGGLCQITEFQIPFFISDLKVFAPCYILSGAVGGIMVSLVHSTTPTFHGGLFTAFLASNVPLHLLCILVQAAFTVLWIGIFKKDLPAEEVEKIEE